MKNSLNTALLTFIITILFNFGRLIYLKKVQKQSLENKRTFTAVIRNDIFLRVATVVGFTLVTLDLTRYFFRDLLIS
ncbi:MAG: hypothetical protein CVV24_11415 [Ignavibacteriae bacterium HGW-Ignavibacteriae-3]|nr:MAG: hypothetical protein CVV24_11415 [Ignavibacteriae bacterium HGW-Ignavibacteriae-3]